MTKLVMVETISSFRIRYCVEVEDNIDDAVDQYISRETSMEFKEFSQEWMGSMPISHREISKEDYLQMFNQDNQYASSWSDDQKFSFINKVQET